MFSIVIVIAFLTLASRSDAAAQAPPTTDQATTTSSPPRTTSTTVRSDPHEEAASAIGVAQAIIAWSGVVLAVVAVGLASAGIVGGVEIRRLRQRYTEVQDLRNQLNAELQHLEGLRSKWQSDIASYDERLTRLVETAYLFNEGEQAYAAGDYLRAVDRFRAATDLEGTNAKILCRLGRAYTNLGEEDQAVEAFARAANCSNTDGERAAAERGLAVNLRYTAPVSALQHAEAAAQLAGHDVKTLNVLGLLYRDVGRLDEAIDAHTRAIALRREEPITHFYLALLCASKKNWPSSHRHFVTALDGVRVEEASARIKPLWASVIRVCADLEGGGRLTKGKIEEIALLATSARRRREVFGHLEYLLTALDRQDEVALVVGQLQEHNEG